MLDYVFNVIGKFGSSVVEDDLYLLIPSNEVDGIEKALMEFTREADGDWLSFDIQPIVNHTDYILRLYFNF